MYHSGIQVFVYIFQLFVYNLTSFSVQRTRGGRHGYSPVKQRSNSVEKYPTIQLPNISAVMSAIKNETHEQNNMEPADIVSVSMSPPSSDHNESTGLFTFLSAAAVCLVLRFYVKSILMVFVTDQDQPQTPSNMITPSFLSKSQIWEQFVSENVQNEVELLKSRASIAENLVAEKSKQLEIVQV